MINDSDIEYVDDAEFLQVVEDGYEFFARRQLVTVFSAPNYCGEFDNAGAMMSVDDTLMCSFQGLCCCVSVCNCRIKIFVLYSPSTRHNKLVSSRCCNGLVLLTIRRDTLYSYVKRTR